MRTPVLFAGSAVIVLALPSPGPAGAQAPGDSVDADAPPSLAAALAASVTADSSTSAEAKSRSPDLPADAALLTLGTTAYAMARNKHRSAIFRKGSLSNVIANFRYPVKRALRSRDDDSFLTNYVAHPVTWGGIALYLKSRGYSDLGAFALSQAHSVYWEYVIEGSYIVPSGRDMVTNFVSSAAVVFVLPLFVGELFPDDGQAPRVRDGPAPALELRPTVVPGPGGPMLRLLSLRMP